MSSAWCGRSWLYWMTKVSKRACCCRTFAADKIYDRYKDCGVGAFSDRSRRPHRQANRLPPQLEAVIVRLKREYPGWGAPKIREKLRRQSTAPHLPAISTAHAVLDRYGLVKRRRRQRRGATGTELSRPTEPNALWCADYKGEFMFGNRRYCYPFHDQTIAVTHCGRICFKGQKVNLSTVFAGQNVGVTQLGDRIWLVTFMQYDLGYFDDETCRLEPTENPFGPKVLPMSPE